MRVYLDGNLRGPRWTLGSMLRKTTDIKLKSKLGLLLDVDNKCPHFLNFILNKKSEISNMVKKRFTKETILSNKNFSTHTNKLLIEIVEACGITPIYELKKHKKQDIECTVNFGSAFNCKKYENFESKSCNVFIADAFIENVSELDRMFNECVEKKEELVIVCRGASMDVINTLSVNRLRGTFRIYLVELPLDLKTVNSLVDVGIVCNSDIVNTSKGDLLCSKGLEDTRRVDKIKFYEGKLSIFNKKNIKNIFIHKKQLIEKMNESTDFGTDLITDRLKQLGPYSCSIWLPSTLSENDLEELDNALRWISSCSKHGYFEYEDKIYPANLIEFYKGYQELLAQIDA